MNKFAINKPAMNKHSMNKHSMNKPSMNKPVILCVDDEKIVLTSLKEQLKRPFGNKFTVETVESGEEALECLQDLLTENIEHNILMLQ